MITSKKGKEMLKNISPIYAKSKIEQAIYEAIGIEFDDIDRLMDEILMQLFPQTATWGLVFWEQRLNISTNLNEDINKRRKNVIVKMQNKWPLTPERLASVIKSYTNMEVGIIEDFSNYKFKIKFTGDKGIPENIDDLRLIIKKIKPSHLSFEFEFTWLTWDEFDYYNKTFDEWDALNLTWDKFEIYREVI